MQRNSLTFQLFTRLLYMLLPLMLVSGVGSYWFASHAVTKFYDRNLYRTALALADQITLQGDLVSVDIPKIAEELIEFDTDDDIHFRILFGQKDLVKKRSLNFPDRIPEPDQHLFYATQIQGESLQAVIYHLPIEIAGKRHAAYVLVGETTQKRDFAVKELVLAMLAVELMMAVLLFVTLYFGVKRGLHPLSELSHQLIAKQANDTTPLETTLLPVEFKPIVAAFNQKLRKLDDILQAQQRFVSNAAHQLKTPLAGLKMQAELALRANNLEKAQHALHQLQHATENMNHTVHQLLTLARAEHHADGEGIPMVPLSLTHLLQEVVRQWQVLAHEKSIALQSDFSAEATITGNAALLTELLNNVLDNALRYTPPQGRIVMRLQEEAGRPVIEIQDNGVGLEPLEAEQVFERFYRVLENHTEGSGLGLTIAQEIAHRHQAHISLHSQGLGHGVCVRIVF